MHKGSDGAVGTPALPRYWVADAKLGYRVNRNLDFQLNVYNLFDTDYVASINKSGYRYHPGEQEPSCSQQYAFLIQMWGAGPTFWRTCMMYHIPGVLSPQDVARFREQLEQAEWWMDASPPAHKVRKLRTINRSTPAARYTPPCKMRC